MKSRVSEFFLAGITVAAASAFVFSAQGPANAKSDETGLAETLHTVVSVGKNICMKDHFHFGDSDDQISKKKAKKTALYAWSSFAELEYGGAWSNIRIARDRKNAAKPKSTHAP